MTPREAVLRVAVQEAIAKAVAAEYEKVRAQAAEVLRQAGMDGMRQVSVLLPSGTVIGRVTVKDPPVAGAVDDAALLQWARGHNTEALEDYADPGILRDPDVLAVLKDKFPDLVQQRVRAATRTAYLKEADKAGGWLSDEDSGEKVRIVTSETLPLTGDFTFTDGKAAQRRSAIMAAILDGDRQVREIAFGGMLPLPAAEGGGDSDG